LEKVKIIHLGPIDQNALQNFSSHFFFVVSKRENLVIIVMSTEEMNLFQGRAQGCDSTENASWILKAHRVQSGQKQRTLKKSNEI